MGKAKMIYNIEGNLWDLYRLVSGHLQIPINESEGLSYINASPAPWPYFIFMTQRSEISEERVANIADTIKDKKLPPFIITSPGISLLSRIENLQYQGIKLVMKWPAMYKNIGAVVSETRNSVALVEVSGIKEARSWFQLVEKNLFQRKQFEEKFYDLVSLPSLKFFLCSYEDQYAGTVLVHFQDKIAGIYMVSIDNKLRGRGVGTAMIEAVMEQIKIMGATTVVLEANNNSEAFYAKMGFQSVGNFEIYWKIGLF